METDDCPLLTVATAWKGIIAQALKRPYTSLPDRQRALLRTMEEAVRPMLIGDACPAVVRFPELEDIWQDVTSNMHAAKEAATRVSSLWRGLHLAAIHFRAPWLSDGRASLAGTPRAHLTASLSASEADDQRREPPAPDTDPLCINFHARLLMTYFRIYSRPFTFNDRLFEVSASSEGRKRWPHLWCLHFGTEGGDEILTQEADRGSVVRYDIRVPTAILRSLTTSESGDVRRAVFDAVQETKDSSDRGMLAVRRLRESGDLARLMDAVELTWHSVLAEPGSFKAWRGFLRTFRFSAGLGDRDGWHRAARYSLLNALWYLQGISLYQMFAGAQLATITLPDLGPDGFSGAITLGSNANADLDFALNDVLPVADRVLTVMIEGAKAGFRPSEASPLALDTVLRQPDETKLTDVLRQRSWIATGESVLSEVLQLCMELDDAVHEGVGLDFQFFLGSAVDIAQFREIYVFRDEEQATFKDLEAIDRARVLRAHYSHLQEPNVGLFVEWGRGVNIRVVETVQIRQPVSPLASVAGLREGEIESGRHATALALTAQTPSLAVAHAGRGRIRLYMGGQIILAWPRKGTRSWWSPDETPSWTAGDRLERLLTGLSSEKFTEKHAKMLAQTLLWVSEAPGLGCSLVAVPSLSYLKNHLVSLNPKSLAWISSVPLEGCDWKDIRNVLIQDGATILDLGDGCLYGQRQLVAFKDSRVLDPSDTTHDKARWTYGTRHAAACDITVVVPCTAITVSADGPITVFRRGAPQDPRKADPISILRSLS